MSFDDLRLDVPIGWKDFMYYLTKPQWGKLRKGIRVEDVIPIQKNQAFIREAFKSFTDEDFKNCFEYWKVNQDSKPRPPRCPEETWNELDAFICEELPGVTSVKRGIKSVKDQFPAIAWGDMTPEDEFIWFMYCRKGRNQHHAQKHRGTKKAEKEQLQAENEKLQAEIAQLQAGNERLAEQLEKLLDAAEAAGLCEKPDIKPDIKPKSRPSKRKRCNC
eukprot:UC1_evm1s711